jgi:hypothetical protein
MRCIVDYDNKVNPNAKSDLERLGIGVTYQNTSSGKMIASIPEERFEEAKGLIGILGITISPLDL